RKTHRVVCVCVLKGISYVCSLSSCDVYLPCLSECVCVCMCGWVCVCVCVCVCECECVCVCVCVYIGESMPQYINLNTHVYTKCFYRCIWRIDSTRFSALPLSLSLSLSPSLS